MSTALSSALSGLETSLQSSIPSDAELRHLESLLIQAHQAKIQASVAAAHAAAQAQLSAAHAAAQAQLDAQIATSQAAAAAQVASSITAQLDQIQPFSNQQPATSNQQLATSNQQPVAEELATSNQQPVANEPISANLATEPTSANEPISANLATSNQQPTAKSVNARYANLNAGLNDRLAFVKSLFGGDDHDYQRVVAYLATLESKAECETFIREAVQPEYDWSKCPDVADRFMNLVYARFE